MLWPTLFGVLVAALVATRFLTYGQSLWEDEIFTIGHYIAPGPTGSFGHYGTNDHILFSILTWLTIYLPALPDTAYRLWAILPFIGAVGLTAFWLYRRADRIVAAIFLYLSAASPLLLILTTEARGYGLAFLSMSVLMISGYEVEAHADDRWLTVFSAAGVAGTWTLPTFILPFAGVAAMLLRRREGRAALARRLSVSSAAILLFYAAPAGALWHSRSQQFGTRLPWHAPLSGGFSELAAAFVPLVGSAAPGFQAFVIAFTAPLLLSGWMTARNRLGPHIGAVTIAPVLCTFAVLTVTRFFVEARFLSYLLAPLFVLAAFGIRSLFAERKLWIATATYAGSLLVIAGFIGYAAARAADRAPIQANRDAAQAIVAALAGSSGGVILNTLHPRDIRYYLPMTIDVIGVPRAQLQRFVCARHAQPLVLVQQPTAGIHLVETRCLQDATRRVFQQRSYGHTISLWTIPAR